VSADAESGQLEWERRAGRVAAAAAFAAGVLPFISFFVLASSISSPGEGRAGLLAAADESSAAFLAGAALTALGFLLLPIPLGYLFRASTARRPETPGIALPLLIAAAVGTAAILIVEQVLLLDVAGDFAAEGSMTEEVADDLVAASAVDTAQLVRFALSVALGAAVLLIALNAMRAGLLSRFVGIIGVAVGVFIAVPILGGATLIQLFWLVALGMLFLGRWPGGGRGPAWDRVEAVPWPGAAERMEADRAARVDKAQRLAYGDSGDEGAGSGEKAEPSGDGGDAPDPRPASRKRRRGR